jgi:hypothetical protein
MLPYPTDRRRLLMMVRAFLHEFAAIVSAHGDGLQHPSAADPWADHQFEAFLERLAVDASQVDEDAAVMETEVEVQHSIQQHLCDLLQHAAWHRDRIRWN